MKHPKAALIPHLFFDQRGSGCSTPYPDEAPRSKGDIEGLGHFAAREIVADAEDLRAHLFGKRPWVVVGKSYGSLLVHRYVVEHPASVLSVLALGFPLVKWVDDYERLWGETLLDRARDFYFERPEYAYALESLLKMYRAQSGCEKDLFSCDAMLQGVDTIRTKLFRSALPLEREEAFRVIDAEIADRVRMGSIRWIVTPTAPSTLRSGRDHAIAVISRIDYFPERYAPEDPKFCWQARRALFDRADYPDAVKLLLNAEGVKCPVEDPLQADLRSWIGELPGSGFGLGRFSSNLPKKRGFRFHLFAGELDESCLPKFFEQEREVLSKHPSFEFRLVPGNHWGFFESPHFWEALRN